MAEALLTIENLSKTFGEKILFENISFGINVGQKTGLIARNGTGKTTLLNILAGKCIQDSGKITFRNNIKIAYLPQQTDTYPKQRVRDFVYSAQKYETEESWEFEQRIEEILSRLKIDMLLDRTIESLSGGEQKKVALSRILIDQSQLIILDEPTNHLDYEMIEWLEDYLSRQKLSILLVTHDRYFLDKVCDNILELTNGKIYHHQGNYEYYKRKKAEREYNERIEIEKAKSLYKTELEWMRRMPQARGTKAQARIDAFYELEEKAHTKTHEKEVQLTVKTERIGGKILEMYNVSKSFGDKIMINDFSYTFKRGEKIGIVGSNGIGKSTFLKLITENLRPDSGKIVVGQTIQFGYYSQDGMTAKDDMRVIDIIKETAETIALDNGKEMSAHQFLTYFGFEDTTQYNYFKNLSGGERRRLYLLKVLMQNPNFLILDEPTNDLDIHTLEILEKFLITYKGCILIVSHDRSFMDNIVDHIFVFEGNGKIKDYHSSYSRYRENLIHNKKTEQKLDKPKEAAQPKPKKTNKPTYKEQKEYEKLTEEIETLTAEKVNIETLLSSGTLSAEDISRHSVRIGELIEILDEKEMRWLELDELF